MKLLGKGDGLQPRRSRPRRSSSHSSSKKKYSESTSSGGGPTAAEPQPRIVEICEEALRAIGEVWAECNLWLVHLALYFCALKTFIQYSAKDANGGLRGGLPGGAGSGENLANSNNGGLSDKPADINKRASFSWAFSAEAFFLRLKGWVDDNLERVVENFAEQKFESFCRQRVKEVTRVAVLQGDWQRQQEEAAVAALQFHQVGAAATPTPAAMHSSASQQLLTTGGGIESSSSSAAPEKMGDPAASLAVGAGAVAASPFGAVNSGGNGDVGITVGGIIRNCE